MTTKIIVRNAFVGSLLAEEGITPTMQEVMQPVEAASKLEKVSARLEEGVSTWQEEDALIDEGYMYADIIGHDRTYLGVANYFKDVVDDLDERQYSLDW